MSNIQHGNVQTAWTYMFGKETDTAGLSKNEDK